MRNTDQINNKRRNEISVGRLEIGVGLVIAVWGSFHSVLVDFFPALETQILYGLLPLPAMFLGFTLIGAGVGLIKDWRWPYLMHIPLLLGVVVTLLAFL